MTHPGPVEGPPAQASSRYAMGSLGNMGRSLIVILALVAGLVAIVPRMSSVPHQPVDAGLVVAYAVKDSGTPYEAPADLPDGWQATLARYAATADLPTWQAGWATPSGQFINLKQAAGATPAWLATVTNQAYSTGTTVLAGGRTWEVRRDSRGTANLVQLAGTGVTTVVTSTADDQELRTFLESLRPVTPAA